MNIRISSTGRAAKSAVLCTGDIIYIYSTYNSCKYKQIPMHCYLKIPTNNYTDGDRPDSTDIHNIREMTLVISYHVILPPGLVP